MKTYKVRAACVVFGIKTDEGRKEYGLKRGEEVELPEDDLSVRVMVRQGQLVEVEKSAGKKPGK